MKLKTYLKTVESASCLARRIGAFLPDVSCWANEKRPIPPHWAADIERATNGLVTRAEMNVPNKTRIWPELAEGELK